MKKLLLGWALCLATLCPAVNEIDYVETFALAEDRAAALTQLIPGTDDYYYYHCLHFQNTGNRAQYDAFMKLWKERHRNSGHREMLENRQALVDYSKTPEASLELFRKRLGLNYAYARKTQPVKGLHPTSLDPALIEPATLLAQVMKANNHQGSSGLTDEGLALLKGQDLTPELRRDLLKRLIRPDYPGLVELIDADLRAKNSGGFGSMQIHLALLIDQLDALLKKMPELNTQEKFVHLYLSKLKPNNDVAPRHNPAEMAAYLDRLNSAVKTLDPVFNSLKAHALYHTLAFERDQGAYNAERFLDYLKLPRNAQWTHPEYLKRADMRNVQSQLNATFDGVTLFPPIHNDEGLLRDFLEHLLVKAANTDVYAPFLRDTWLKQVFAETQILNGVGASERWASMLSPAQYEALKTRVDLRFAHTNTERFGPNDPVTLKLQLKNVNELLIKVYEINAYNLYRDTMREIDTAINLDGLIATVERKEDLRDQPAERRIDKAYTFPELKQPGVYVVEFIGNGVSSRALVFKGRLNMLHQVTPDGHLITVLDADNRQVKDADVWMAGKSYAADRNGFIALPFSTQPKRETLILRRGKQASLATFQHGKEYYSFQTGFYIDREALLQHREATVLVRPHLTLAGTKISVKELEDVRLVYETTNVFGIKTRKDVNDFKLFDTRESMHSIRIPDRLTNIRFELHARIKNLSTGQHEDLSAQNSFALNAMDRTAHIDALLSTRVGSINTLELRGRNGEGTSHQVLHLELKHWMFNNPTNVQLQTDEDGRCILGRLSGVEWYKVRGPNGVYQQFFTDRDRVTLPEEVHGAENQALTIPVNSDETQAVLIDEAHGQFRRDFSQHATFKDGRLHIAGLPAGDYALWIGDASRIPVRIAKGHTALGRAFSPTRSLQIPSAEATSITGMSVDKTGMTIQLAETNHATRVHVIATRYAPEYDLYNQLRRGPGRLSTQALSQANTLYVAGRSLGDEYRYILDRQQQPHYPGNLAERPGLLLNPWALRKTDQGEEQLARGSEYKREANNPAAAAAAPMPAKPRSSVRREQKAPSLVQHYPLLDFLAEGSLLAANLVPDDKGVVHVPLELLRRKCQVRVLVLGSDHAILRTLNLPDSDLLVRDLRLEAAFDPAVPMSEQKLISILKKGKPFTIKDLAASELEIFDSIADIYQLLSTLNQPEHLDTFGFVRTWESLKKTEKQDLYAKYASHELNFFIQQKDSGFFKSTVLPYLKNKKDATFMDQWLTGAPLEAWRAPWAFGRLNTVERILLGQRMADDRAGIERHVRERFELLPPDRTREGLGFDTALAAGLSGLGTTWAFRAGNKLGEVELRMEKSATAGTRVVRLAALSDASADMVSIALDSAVDGKVADEFFKSGNQLARHDLVAVDDKSNNLTDDFTSSLAGEPQRRGRYGKALKALYRNMPATEELAENNYYRLPIEQQLSGLITPNRFWADYAAHPAGQPFLSRHFTDAAGNLSEILLALAVLDLPFTAGEHTTDQEEARLTLTPAHDLILFHKEIRPAEKAANMGTPLLISQQFFRADDRWRTEGSEKVEQFVKDEFLHRVVYGCKVIVTNPGGNAQELNLLLQIPQGALPVQGGFVAKGVPLRIDAHATQSVEYTFYFPEAGVFPHYPVHVAKEGLIVGQAKPFIFKVVEALSEVDKDSWPWISQDGSHEQVLDYLNTHNIEATALDDIAWRMKDKAFFSRIIRLLDSRQMYHHTLYSFGLLHNDLPAARAWLQHSPIARQCGYAIDTALLTVDPVAQHVVQHLEYAPLVNPRVHPVSKTPTILNHRLREQYHTLCGVLSNRATLDNTDRLTVTYYLALQDRIEEALAWFARVDRTKITSQLQYDYLQAFLGMYEGNVEQARTIATRYTTYPVPRWRNKFLNILSQLDDAGVVIDPDDRDQKLAQQAASEPALDFQIEAGQIAIDYQQTTSAVLNFYPMDIELLFSRNPFVQSQGRSFSYIEPMLSRSVQLPADQQRFTYELPAQFRGRNVMVEAISGGLRKSRPYYANSLNVQLLENYGQVQVRHADTQAALDTVYVKVYAQLQDGSVRFWKDGYTDFRGRFDYVSLNTNDLAQVQRFSLLLMSTEHGAMIKEASPPKR